MGKQTDAIVYYCDKCRKAIVGTGIINNTSEGVSVAHNISIYEPVKDDTIFSSSEINKFMIPVIKVDPENINQQTGTADAVMKIEMKTKYLCQDCAKDKVDKYIELCNEISDLFGWKK